MLGVMELEKAIRVARNQKLDLVELSPKAVPPVCKILDFAKYKYESQKKARKDKQKQRVTVTKELRLKINIGPGDFDTRIRQIRNFIEEGDKVKVSVVFKGREVTHPEVGEKLVNRIREAIQDFASLEKEPQKEGYNIVLMIVKKKE